MQVEDVAFAPIERPHFVAKPDLDDGFLMIAHELFSAVMTAHMPQEARLVVVEVFSQIYGPARRKAAALSPTDIGKRTGTHASSVARGIKFAVTNGIVRREGLHAYHFVKDYESWGTEGKPLLPRNMAMYAACAPTLAVSHKFTKGPQIDAPRKAKKINESVNPSVNTDEPEAPPILTGTLKIINESVNPPPYRDKGEEVVVVEGESIPTPPLTLTPKTGKPALWAKAPFKHDPAEVDRIATLCGELAGPEEDTIPGNVRRNCRSYPLWYFPYSIRQALALAPPGKVWAYAVGIMRRLWAQGIEEEPQEAPAEVGPPRPSFAPADPARLRRQSLTARSMSAFDDPPDTTKERA